MQEIKKIRKMCPFTESEVELWSLMDRSRPKYQKLNILWALKQNKINK